MFDIGFSEILVIFILALLVLGPEKLPRVVREAGRWIGRARAMARQFREQLEDEVDLNPGRADHTRPAEPPETREPAPSIATEGDPLIPDRDSAPPSAMAAAGRARENTPVSPGPNEPGV